MDSWVLRTLIREVMHTFIVYREDDEEDDDDEDDEDDEDNEDDDDDDDDDDHGDKNIHSDNDNG